MKVVRVSPLTGKENTMEIDVTVQQMIDYVAFGKLAQEAFPNITPAEREFIMTGYTQEDWDQIFPKGDDE